jgi:hypothetical protein
MKCEISLNESGCAKKLSFGKSTAKFSGFEE